MKNVLITGGAGFIGSHLVDKMLAEQNWRVTVIDDFNDFYNPQIKRANVSSHLNEPNYSLIEADIRDAAALQTIFERRHFDVVVHLAARAGVRPSLDEPLLYTETNINGTLNLLELCRRFGVKQFVFGSSSSVYGANCKVPFSETDLVSHPISPYAATKAAGELLCYTYTHLYELRAVCLRFFTVYGARQRPDLAIRKFTRLIADGKPIPVFGDGRTRRDYTYVDDIIAGVRAAIDYRQSDYEIFNLGESHTVELSELISLIESNLNKKAIIERLPAQPGDVPQTFADITKAKKLLDYNPQTQIEAGIGKFAEWFAQQENLLTNTKIAI